MSRPKRHTNRLHRAGVDGWAKNRRGRISEKPNSGAVVPTPAKYIELAAGLPDTALSSSSLYRDLLMAFGKE